MVTERKHIIYKDKVVFERLTMSTELKKMPKIFFENEACFLFVLNGTFNFRTPDSRFHFSKGEGMLAQCGNYLIETNTCRQISLNNNVSVIGAFFYPEIVKEFFKNDLSLKPFQSALKVSKISIEPILKTFVEGLIYLLDNPSLVDENLIITKQKELLILLSKFEHAQSINDFINSLFLPFAYDLKKIIEKNLYSDLTISELAYLAGMSTATFKRNFKKLYEQSPAKYILKMKLNYSLTLLKIKSKPISEIAYDCGFNSASSFNKAFKKYLRITPTEYRDNEKKKSLSQLENENI